MTQPLTTADESLLDEQLLEFLIQADESLRSGGTNTKGKGDKNFSADQTRIFSTAQLALEALAKSRRVMPTHLLMPTEGLNQIGRYELEGILGTGGFAVVYRAQDRYLQRVAAVKIPRFHALVSPDLRQRFIREAKAVAQLDHPHIVPIFEAGEEAGVPYIAQAYCAGPTLAEWIEQRLVPIPVRLVARVLRLLADAVQFTHSRGILHRDLKPSNVLLFPEITLADTEFPYIAKLADFGLAKQIDLEGDATASGAMLGTPRYMAPEQISAHHDSIGPAADVYGLGGVLYEMLTQQAPFTATATWDVLTQVQDYAPAAPRLLRPQIPQDLETICLTCLAKDPSDRYLTAAALSADLGRFLDGQPILARPVSWPRQIWKWALRHQLIASLALTSAGAVVLLLAGLGVHSWQMDDLTHRLEGKNEELEHSVKQLDASLSAGNKLRTLAELRARELARTVYAIEVRQAAEAWKRGDVRVMTRSLEPFREIALGEDDLRDFTWHYLWGQQAAQDLFRKELPARQYVARFSPDGRQVAFAGADSILRLYQARNFQLEREIHTDQKEVNDIRIDPHGKWAFTTGDDGTLAKWNLKSGDRLGVWQYFDNQPAYQIVCSEQTGLGVVCGKGRGAVVFDLKSGNEVWRLENPTANSIESLSLSHDGNHVLACSSNGYVWVINLSTREHKNIGGQHGLGGYISGCAWSPDDRHLAFASSDSQLYVRQSHGGGDTVGARLFDMGQSMTAGPDGLLLVGDRGGSVNVFRNFWNTPFGSTFNSIARWTIHRDRVYGMDVSPDGKTFATASRDQQVAVHQLRLTEPVVIQRYVDQAVNYTNRSVIGPDQDGLYYRISQKSIVRGKGRSLEDRETLITGPEFYDVAMLGRHFFAGDSKGRLYYWDLDHPTAEPQIDQVITDRPILTVTPLDEHRIFVMCSGQVLLWDLRTRGSWNGLLKQGDNVAVSNDGKLVALTWDNSGRISLHDSESLKLLRLNESKSANSRMLRFSESGRLLVSGNGDRSINVFDTTTMKIVHVLNGHDSAIRSFAISPDERTLASSDHSGSLRLWDLRTGRELMELYKHKIQFGLLEFTPNGDELWGIDGELVEYRWLVQ